MRKTGKRGSKAKARAELRLPKTVELASALTKEYGGSFVSNPHIPVTQLFDELRHGRTIGDFAERYRLDPREIDTVLRAANLLVMETFTGKRLLTAAEVAHQLRRALTGDVVVRLANPKYTWDAAYCGHGHVFIGDWEFWFYNDAGLLDYVDTVISPDGRWVQFREFWDDEDPLFGGEHLKTALLGLEEQRALQCLLEAAK